MPFKKVVDLFKFYHDFIDTRSKFFSHCFIKSMVNIIPSGVVNLQHKIGC